MRAVIVYESLYGNTHEIAEAIGNGMRKAHPDAEVTCVRVGEADPGAAHEADLLVVGGPTHMMRMTTERSRQMGVEAKQKSAKGEAAVGGAAADVGAGGNHSLEPGAAGPGVREWFGRLPSAPAGGRAAAFDTRLPSPLAGGAARGIARRLRQHGYVLVGKPAGFIVGDAEGPLRAGERERAEAWGAELAG